MSKRKIDKVPGLTGDSGLMGSVHIAANYKVEDPDTVFIDDNGGWKRIKKSELKKDDRVITCWKCKRPAVVVSHYYPYEGYESNLCIVHVPVKAKP